MRSGTCIKCLSPTVHMKPNGVQIGENMRGVYIVTSMFSMPSPFVTFLCTNCGYFENYVNDPAKLAEVSKKWVKIKPSNA